MKAALRALAAVAFLSFATIVSSGYSTARVCYHCNHCTAAPCRRRSLGLLEYLEKSKDKVVAPTNFISDVPESHYRHLQASNVTSITSNITCTVENASCPPPYSNYCCSRQMDNTLTCGVGMNWATCPGGSGTKCDFSFPCPDDLQCCNFVSEGSTGTCAAPTIVAGNLVCDHLIVACNYLGLTDSSKQTNRLTGNFQSNDHFCEGGDRANGRCRASNLCCSKDGYCDMADACNTYAYSWVFRGGGVNQNTGVTVPGTWGQNSLGNCGFGTIGNGRCLTSTFSSQFGVVCCSPNGFCGQSGKDPYGQSFCAGVGDADIPSTICFCENGIAAVGSDCLVNGADKCSSCFDGYDFISASNSCVAPSISCPGGTFITKVKLFVGDFVNGVTSITCSNSVTYAVAAGLNSGTTGGTSTVSSTTGFCGCFAVVDKAGIERLTFTACDTGIVTYRRGTATLAGSSTLPPTYCVGGERAIGVSTTTSIVGYLAFFDVLCGSVGSVGPTPTPTSGPPTSVVPTAVPTVRPPLSAPLTFGCPAGKFITQVKFWGEAYVNVIASLVCVDEIVQVSSGGTPSLTTASSGGGFSTSPGYCSSSNVFDRAGVYQLTLTECTTSTIDGPYSVGGGLSVQGSSTTSSCPLGQKLVSVQFTLSSGYLSNLNFLCGSITGTSSCTCSHGTAGSGVLGCINCTSCESGYNLTTSGTCVADVLCTCVNGVGGMGASGCVSCSSCSVGWGVNAFGACAATTTFICSDARFITAMSITVTYYNVYGIESIVCSDGSKILVNTAGYYSGSLLDIPTENAVGFASLSYGYDSTGGITQLKLVESAGRVNGPFGGGRALTGVGGTMSKSCGSGEKAIGLVIGRVLAKYPASGQLYFFNLFCGPIAGTSTLCACSHGVAAVGVVGCAACVSCSSGYNLSGAGICVVDSICSCLNGSPGVGAPGCVLCTSCKSGYALSITGTCDAKTPVVRRCTEGEFITQVQLYSSGGVWDIFIIICSDGQIYNVGAGITSGSISAPTSAAGYCGTSNGIYGPYVVQLKLIECTLGGVDGPFGDNPALSGSIISNSCPKGQKAVGVEKSTDGLELLYFNFVCGSVADLTAICKCVDGIPAVGLVGCITCSSCNYGFGLSATGTCLASGAYVTCTCFNGIAGLGISAGCTTCSSCVTGYNLSASGSCIQGPNCNCLNGSPGSGPPGCHTCISCRAGYYLDVYGDCVVKLTSSCSSGHFITQLELTYICSNPECDSRVGGIVSFMCSDNHAVYVGAGTIGYTFTVASGDGSSASAGYCATSSSPFGTVIQLKLTECTGIIDGPFGTTALLKGTPPSTQYCGTGEKMIGVEYSLESSDYGEGSITYLNFICGPVAGALAYSACSCAHGSPAIGVPGCLTCLTCKAGYSLSKSGACVADTITTCLCTNGTPGSGVPGCVSCVTCDSGFNLIYDGTCVATTTVRCPEGKFITQLTLDSYSIIYGIKTITCSDRNVIPVNGGLVDSSTMHTVASGDGSSASPGYCASSHGYHAGYLAQLQLMECTGEADGPFGYASSTGFTTRACDSGDKAVGVVVSSSGWYLAYLDFVCGPIKVLCNCSNGVPGAGLSGCLTCVSCSPGFTFVSATATCVASSVSVSCPTGFFMTQIRFWNSSGGEWVDGISYIKCSNGDILPVDAGQLQGTKYSATSGDGTSTSSGYCAMSNTFDKTGVARFTLTECTGKVDGSFGTHSTDLAVLYTKICSSGQKGVGILATAAPYLLTCNLICGSTTPTIAPVSFPPTMNPTALPLAVHTLTITFTYQVSLAEVTINGPDIGNVQPSLTDPVDGYPASFCTDGILTNLCQSHSTGVSTIEALTIRFTGTPSSIVVTNDPTDLYSVVGAFMTFDGKTIYVFSTAAAVYTIASFKAYYTCKCANGVGDISPTLGCTTCISCDTGFILSGSNNCAAKIVALCPAGSLLNKITLYASTRVVGIDSIGCSDGSAVVGVTSSGSGGTQYSATSSSGFCSFSYLPLGVYGSQYEALSQLAFAECRGSAIDGPYGTQTSSSYASSTVSCQVGYAASGVMTSWDSGYIFQFSMLCVHICACLNGVPGSGEPGCVFCLSCNPGFTLVSTTTSTCVGPPTASPGTSSPTTVTGCATGSYMDANGICRAATAGILGCFADANTRDLPYPASRDPTYMMTYSACANLCKTAGYIYFGVEVGIECWCGNSFGLYGFSNSCTYSYRCPGDSSKQCGGTWALTVGVVVTVAGTTVPTPAPTTPKPSTAVPVATVKPTTSAPTEFPTVLCPSNTYITKILLHAGNWINQLTSIVCSDASSEAVNAGTSTGGSAMTDTGGYSGTGTSPGYCGTSYGPNYFGITQLSFTPCGGVAGPAYGSDPMTGPAIPTVCATGKKAVGVETVAGIYPTLFRFVCGTITVSGPTAAPTTQKPSTVGPSTAAPTTLKPSTAVPTTFKPTLAPTNAPTGPAYSVRVFADSNYGGKSWTYTCNPAIGQLLLDYASPTYPFDNDAPSSVITGAGVTAYLYADFINTANAVPIQINASTSVSQLNPDNQASSMMLICVAENGCASGLYMDATGICRAAAAGILGCFKDADTRELPYAASRDSTYMMTYAACANLCKTAGFIYFGVEVGYECWCGNSFGVYGVSTDCYYICAGDPSNSCGGPWALTVGVVVTFAGATAPTASPTQKPSTVTPKPSTYSPSTMSPSTAAPTTTLAVVAYQCSTGFVIDTITLRSGTGLNAISNYMCKDASGTYKAKTVNVGDSTAGTSVFISGPFTGFSSGYAVSPNPPDAAAGVSFLKSDGSTVPSVPPPPYGTAYTGITTKNCALGQVIYGFKLALASSGTMVAGSMTALCRAPTTTVPLLAARPSTPQTENPSAAPTESITSVPSEAVPTSIPTDTVGPTTLQPSTVVPTTPQPSSVASTTPAPSTVAPTTVMPSSVAPSTSNPTTVKPSTVSPTTPKPSTAFPATLEPSTVGPTTLKPSTADPTTVEPSTANPTTINPTTLQPSTGAPTVMEPTSSPTNKVTVTESPTSAPTQSPSHAPTSPTEVPTSTSRPTVTPSMTLSPTITIIPTVAPTIPTLSPSTLRPTLLPSTIDPTVSQSAEHPTENLTASPTSLSTYATADYKCSTGFVIDTITLRSSTALNSITKYTCKDSSGTFKTKTVNVGSSSAGTSVTITGPFTSFSSGYAVSPNPTDAASGMSFVRSDGSSVPYGTSYTGITTHTCASGQVIYGFSLAPDSSGTMVSGKITALCRVPSSSPTESPTPSLIEGPTPAPAENALPTSGPPSVPTDTQAPV